MAELLSGEPVAPSDTDALQNALMALMKEVAAPRGLRELGYDPVEAS